MTTAAETEKFIRDYATSIGLNADIVMQTVLNEGGRQSLTDLTRSHIPTSASDTEQSFGPLQLNVKNGVGARAIAAGFDPRDPAQALNALKFGIDVIKNEGLGQWYGWKGDKWAASGGKKGSGAAPAQTADVKTYSGVQGARGDTPSSAHPVGSDLPSQQYALPKADTYGGPGEGAGHFGGSGLGTPAGGPEGRVVARGVTSTPDYSFVPPAVPQAAQIDTRATPPPQVTRGEPISPASPEAVAAQRQQLAALLAALNGRQGQNGQV